MRRKSQGFKISTYCIIIIIPEPLKKEVNPPLTKNKLEELQTNVSPHVFPFQNIPHPKGNPLASPRHNFTKWCLVTIIQQHWDAASKHPTKSPCWKCLWNQKADRFPHSYYISWVRKILGIFFVKVLTVESPYFWGGRWLWIWLEDQKRSSNLMLESEVQHGDVWFSPIISASGNPFTPTFISFPAQVKCSITLGPTI